MKRTIEKRRVVITGMGVASPIGIGTKSFCESLIAGKSGAICHPYSNDVHLKNCVTASIKNFSLKDYMDKTLPSYYYNDRKVELVLVAAKLAWNNAFKEDEEFIDRRRFGVSLGVGIGTIDIRDFASSIMDGSKVDYKEHGKKIGQALPHQFFCNPVNLTCSSISNLFKLQGGNFTNISACVAGAQGIGVGCKLIQRGELDFCLAGGVDSAISPLYIAVFSRLGVMAPFDLDKPCEVIKPFDLERKGFILGEGSGVLVLEELSSALKRKADIYAEIVGYGSSIDGYSLSEPNPTGETAAEAIQNALDDGNIDISEVDYINAHGTGTRSNDAAETCAIKKVFKKYAYKIPVSSTKSMIGHLVAAAGAVEFIATVLSMKNSFIPPTINYKTKDPVCDLDYVPNFSRKAEIDVAISNSFGFGGQNSVLAARRFI